MKFHLHFCLCDFIAVWCCFSGPEVHKSKTQCIFVWRIFILSFLLCRSRADPSFHTDIHFTERETRQLKSVAHFNMVFLGFDNNVCSSNTYTHYYKDLTVFLLYYYSSMLYTVDFFGCIHTIACYRNENILHFLEIPKWLHNDILFSSWATCFDSEYTWLTCYVYFNVSLLEVLHHLV